jgi:hypothetical protein
MTSASTLEDVLLRPVRAIPSSTTNAHHPGEQRAITRDANGRYAIDFVKFPVAVASLAKELLTIEATGNRARAESWMTRYGTMPAQLKAALDKTGSVPVDVDPVTSFGDAAK